MWERAGVALWTGPPSREMSVPGIGQYLIEQGCVVVASFIARVVSGRTAAGRRRPRPEGAAGLVAVLADVPHGGIRIFPVVGEDVCVVGERGAQGGVGAAARVVEMAGRARRMSRNRVARRVLAGDRPDEQPMECGRVRIEPPGCVRARRGDACVAKGPVEASASRRGRPRGMVIPPVMTEAALRRVQLVRGGVHVRVSRPPLRRVGGVPRAPVAVGDQAGELHVAAVEVPVRRPVA